MDVAEQALTALEMLSRRHGKAILQCVSILHDRYYCTSWHSTTNEARKIFL